MSPSHEYVGNLHAHTIYSDGYGTHAEVARAALRAGLDFIVVTDHNVLVEGMDGYWHDGDRRLLMLAGEEVHDAARVPQKNHLLIYETRRELAPLATHPQDLVDAAREAGGHTFLAHPVDPPAPLFSQQDLSWVSWEVQGYTGLEIWNFMTEYKSLLTSWASAIYYAYRPELIAVGPFPEVLACWDQLLATGHRVTAIGNTDAHATPVRKGPLFRIIFPYEFLFRTVNTHVLTDDPLAGDVEADRQKLFASISQGKSFVGYDLLASTRGFSFAAEGDSGRAEMGETIRGRFGVTLQIRLPQRAELQVVRHGEIVRNWPDADVAVLPVNRSGAYRVEAYLPFAGKRRGWIFSNPIYVETRD